MRSLGNIVTFVLVFVLAFAVLHKFGGKQSEPVQTVPPIPVETPVKPVERGPYEISRVYPEKFLNYDEVKTLLRQWNEEAPEITEIGTYGKNRQGTELTYFRIGTSGKPRVLIHACIHGNERLAAAATLGIMGNILKDYKHKDDVTWIVDNREIYFVPVFSPESYLRSRHIEEGDPNRRWAYPGSRTNNGSSPIQEMQRWFKEMKFVAAIDGHTTGRDFFWPSIAKGEDSTIHSNIAREMAGLANYSPSRISSSPSGYAIDWYYWNGAVAILTEFGSGGHDQPVRNIQPETDRTYPAYVYFIKEAPEQQSKLNPPPLN